MTQKNVLWDVSNKKYFALLWHAIHYTVDCRVSLIDVVLLLLRGNLLTCVVKLLLLLSPGRGDPINGWSDKFLILLRSVAGDERFHADESSISEGSVRK